MSSRSEGNGRGRDEPETIAVDTGVWIDALLFGGTAEELVKLGITGRVRLVTCESLLGELTVALCGRLEFSEAAAREVCRFIRDCAEVVAEATQAGAPSAEAALLGVACRAGASAIATTHRRALRRRAEHDGIPIVTIG